MALTYYGAADERPDTDWFGKFSILSTLPKSVRDDFITRLRTRGFGIVYELEFADDLLAIQEGARKNEIGTLAVVGSVPTSGLRRHVDATSVIPGMVRDMGAKAEKVPIVQIPFTRQEAVQGILGEYPNILSMNIANPLTRLMAGAVLVSRVASEQI